MFVRFAGFFLAVLIYRFDFCFANDDNYSHLSLDDYPKTAEGVPIVSGVVFQ